MDITIHGKSINLMDRGVDTMYLTDITDYITRTGLTKDELIRFTVAEIRMLESAQTEYTTAYRALEYLDDRTSAIGDLIVDIAKCIATKTAKLDKYKGLK